MYVNSFIGSLSREHIRYVLEIKIPLTESYVLTESDAKVILERQLIYEEFIDKLTSWIKEKGVKIKDSFLKGIDNFGAFASTMYTIVKTGVSGSFASSLIRDFKNSEIKEKIQNILSKIGQSELLDRIITKVETITNPIKKLLASIGIVSAIKFLFDKFKDLDLSKENVIKQIQDYIKSFISDSAVKALEGFATGGFSSLLDWINKVGMASATVYNTIKNTLVRYKDAFSKGEKVKDIKLIKENKGACCGKCGHVHVKGTSCPKPFLTEKSHCSRRINEMHTTNHDGHDEFHQVRADVEESYETENYCAACLIEYLLEYEHKLEEAEYKGRKVQLGKPMAGDTKKFKVYVKNDKGNVVKVNFGQKGVKIKKSNPARRKSFRARHKCDTNPGPRWKARYWSCRKW